MIPPLEASGQLPPGRYITDLDEVWQAFVLDARFAASTTRADVWSGLLDYLVEWRDVEQAVGLDLLRGLWIGGSFASGRTDPKDVDVSPVVDGEGLIAARGKPGAGRLNRLLGQRDSIRRTYHVEPWPVRWTPIASPFRQGTLRREEHDYLLWRGTMDDWWQRCRPAGPKQAPQRPTQVHDRGYLEVAL